MNNLSAFENKINFEEIHKNKTINTENKINIMFNSNYSSKDFKINSAKQTETEKLSIYSTCQNTIQKKEINNNNKIKIILPDKNQIDAIENKKLNFSIAKNNLKKTENHNSVDYKNSINNPINNLNLKLKTKPTPEATNTTKINNYISNINSNTDIIKSYIDTKSSKNKLNNSINKNSKEKINKLNEILPTEKYGNS